MSKNLCLFYSVKYKKSLYYTNILELKSVKIFGLKRFKIKRNDLKFADYKGFSIDILYFLLLVIK